MLNWNIYLVGWRVLDKTILHYGRPLIISGNDKFRSATMTTSAKSNVNRNIGGKSVPVYKWNMNFVGTALDNVVKFLQRVGYKIFRNVSSSELFNSAVKLFVGLALTWFRSVLDEVHTWEELVLALKAQGLWRPNLGQNPSESARLRGESLHIFREDGKSFCKIKEHWKQKNLNSSEINLARTTPYS